MGKTGKTGDEVYNIEGIMREASIEMMGES